MNLLSVRITKKENADAQDVPVGDCIEVALQQYLYGVVASEVGDAHIEACKAQAVAARTNAYPYFESGKAISDSENDVQCFRVTRMFSVAQSYPNAKEAVDETDGQILLYKGKVASPCSFSASNGGRTTSSQERWGGERAWLIARDDPWDRAAMGGKKTGHGVGMSQAGAKYAAQNGHGYREILQFYYPNTTISTDMKEGGEAMAAQVKASYQIEKFRYMLNQHWKYVLNAAEEGKVDCSGAFYYWYKKAGSYMYHGSNTMYRQYSTQKGRIGELELVPGMAVYKQRNDGREPQKYRGDGIGNLYHVGLYIGDGKVIEAKGTYYGIVESCISEWSHASRLKDTIYDVQETGGGDMETPDFVGPKQGKVVTESGSLNLRKEPVNGTVLTRIPRLTQITLTGMKDGWYQTTYNGYTGYVSPSYIEIIEEGNTPPTESAPYTVYCVAPNKDVADQIAALITQNFGIVPTIGQD